MKPKTYVVGTLTALTVAASVPAEVSPARAGDPSAPQLKLSPAAKQGILNKQLKLNKAAGATSIGNKNKDVDFLLIIDHDKYGKNKNPVQSNVRSSYKKNINSVPQKLGN